MSEEKTYPVPAEFAAQANINAEQYAAMYKQSVEDPEGFWGEQANQYLSWFKPWDKVLDWSFMEDDLHIGRFLGPPSHQQFACAVGGAVIDQDNLAFERDWVV